MTARALARATSKRCRRRPRVPAQAGRVVEDDDGALRARRSPPADRSGPPRTGGRTRAAAPSPGRCAARAGGLAQAAARRDLALGAQEQLHGREPTGRARRRADAMDDPGQRGGDEAEEQATGARKCTGWLRLVLARARWRSKRKARSTSAGGVGRGREEVLDARLEAGEAPALAQRQRLARERGREIARIDEQPARVVGLDRLEVRSARRRAARPRRGRAGGRARRRARASAAGAADRQIVRRVEQIGHQRRRGCADRPARRRSASARPGSVRPAA